MREFSRAIHLISHDVDAVRLCRSLAAVFVMLWATLPVLASRTILVPEDVGTIEEALSMAASGDVIELGPGVYLPERPIDSRGLSLTIKGAGQGRTIIDGGLLGAEQGLMRFWRPPTDAPEPQLFVQSLTLRNVSRSARGPAENPVGGAITAEHVRLSIDRVAFDSGRCVYGGGVGLVGGELTVTNSSFNRCGAGLFGGGVYLRGSRSARISSTRFTGSQADLGGGAIAAEDVGSLSLSGVTMLTNKAAAGGALWLESVPAASISRSTLSGNRAIAEGGALTGLRSTLTIDHSVFSGNRAELGGSIALARGSAVTVRHSAADSGSAALGSDLHAAAGSEADILNSILWSSGETIAIEPGGRVTVERSITRQRWTGFGSGNLNANPLFVNALGNDAKPGTGDERFDLRPGSPAIDAGDASLLPQGVGRDFAGRPRLHDDTGSTDHVISSDRLAPVDIGPYEFQGHTTSGGPCLADIAEPRDQFDTADIAAVTEWIKLGDPRADFAEPFGVFDADDLLAFAFRMGNGCGQDTPLFRELGKRSLLPDRARQPK